MSYIHDKQYQADIKQSELKIFWLRLKKFNFNEH